MKKASLFIELILIFSLFAGLAGAKCGDKDKSPAKDPLKEKALEHYAEGRRLFLSCDPNVYAKAKDEFDMSLSFWEDNPEALAARAETISMWYGFMLPEEAFQAAYMDAQRAVRLDPDLDMGYRAMADLFRHHRDPETGEFDVEYALSVIERAMGKNPDSAENLYVKGSIYLSRDPAAAIEILQKAVSLNPNLGKSYFNLASARQMLADRMKLELANDPEKLEEARQAIDAHYAEAERLLGSYVRIVPGDLAGYCSSGIVKQRLGKTDEAETMFQETVKINRSPDKSQDVWRILAYLQLASIAETRDSDLEAARLYLDGAYKLAPMNRETLLRLIDLSGKQKNEDDVKRFAEELQKAQTTMRERLAPQAGDTAGTAAGDAAAPMPGGDEAAEGGDTTRPSP